MTAEWFIPLGRGFGADKSKQFVIRAVAKYGFMVGIIKNYNSLPLNVSRWVMRDWPMVTIS
jgi:hypothetical protein